MLVSVGRRLLVVVVAAAAVAAPAIVLRALCVGRSCARPGTAPATVPFCSLPERVRTAIVDGFEEARAPDVFAIAGGKPVVGSTALPGDDLPVAWPRERADDAGVVPLAIVGPGIRGPSDPAPGTQLDDIAPTIAELIRFRRPHPERLRSGRAIPGFTADEPPSLVVEVVWKGIGTRDLRRAGAGSWPRLRGAIRGDLGGGGTLDALIGSLPLDPAAVMATIGTGGLPRLHGITGTLLRNDDGRLVRAWTRAAPPTIIAGLGDDLDELSDQRARIGLVGTDVSDRGAIGGTWYEVVGIDRDDIRLRDGTVAAQLQQARALLDTGYGDDDVTDLLVVVLRDEIERMDAAIPALYEMLSAETGGSFAMVVTATGSVAGPKAMPASEVVRDVDRAIGGEEPSLLEASAVGGLFLDQRALVRTGRSSDDAVRALRDLRTPGGAPLFADAFPGTSVTFARYC